MYRSNDFYRTQIFEKWFEAHVTKYVTMKDGKLFDTRIDIKYAPFINTFNNVFKANMRHYDSRMDCYADCMAVIWEGMLKFEVKGESNWYRIANKEDIDNYKKLVSYLKKYVVQNIKRINQDYLETSRNIIDGKHKKNIHLIYNVSPQSLNQILTFDNSLEQIELIDTVQNSYWEEKTNYRYGIFAEWARNNMNEFLTKSQKELLETLQSANYGSYDNDYDRKILDKGKGQIKLRLERIHDKVCDKYKETQKLIIGGYLVQEIDNELKSYQKIINVLSDENNFSEETLIQVIISSMNNQYWERLIYESISDEAQYDIIWLYQNSALVYEDNFKLYNHKHKLFRTTLYEVVNAVSERIIFLIDKRSEEMAKLEKEAETKKIKVHQPAYKIPKNYGYVYLQKTPTGILIQK